MSKNANLHKAKDAKNDEFYTQLNDVANELKHYRPHFKDKIVLCNCDDPTWSAFWKYFHLNFELLGLKKLISTHYDREQATYKMEYTGGDDNNIEAGIKTPLEGNGDFRNAECIDLLKEADIVVTNEPFSLTREYIAQLVEYDKQFLIIVNKNAITYKEIFPLIKNDKIWLGCTNVKEFLQPDGTTKKFGNIGWFTNLDIQKRHEDLLKDCWKHFSEEEYPMYDNYCAWNINKVTDIFVDEDIEVVVDNEKLEQIKKVYGSDATVLEAVDSKTRVKIHHPVMGVPITFLDKYNPEEFELLGLTTGRNEFDKIAHPTKRYVNAIQHNKNGTTTSGSKANTRATLINNNAKNIYYTADNADGKLEIVYARILIRRKEKSST